MVSKIEFSNLLEIEVLEKACFSSPYSLNVLESAYKSSGFYGLAYKDERILGYLLINRVLDEANIDKIAVTPEFRNRKIASTLIEFAESELKSDGVKSIYLEVSVKNDKAISLYKKHGYIKVYVRKNYYGENDDALIFKKDL